LVTDRLKELAGDEFLFRSIDIVQPKGVLTAIQIYELLNERSTSDPDCALEKYALRWEKAIGLYRQLAFTEALAEFEALASERTSDPVASLYIRRSREFSLTPPPEGWDGVHKFDSK
jgi:adenylate cyclase